MEDKSTALIGQGRRGPGRIKGVPNKLNGAIKDMVVTALTKAGGAKYLEKQAHEQPVAFMGLLGRVLPLQIRADMNINAIHRVERVIVDPANPDS